jgi:hypothetical protein
MRGALHTPEIRRSGGGRYVQLMAKLLMTKRSVDVHTVTKETSAAEGNPDVTDFA